MPFAVKAIALVCLVLHLGFFAMESVAFPYKLEKFKAESPAGKLPLFDFSTKGEDNARTLRVFAFNMGCYNLLLACGIGYSLAIASRFPGEARTVLAYICCVMIVAGIVLGVTASWLWLFAIAQSGFPAICVALMRGQRGGAVASTST